MPLRKTVIRAGSSELAGLVEPGPAKGDVIGLPLARRAGGVGQRGILAINRADLAVGVGVGLVRIEHLKLELAHQEDPAVAPVLADAHRRIGRSPLDVQLNVPELTLRLDRPGPRNDLEDAILHAPSRRAPFRRLPGVQACSIEQNYCVLRRRSRGGCRSSRRLDHRRTGTVDVMLLPAEGFRLITITGRSRRQNAQEPGHDDRDE